MPNDPWGITGWNKANGTPRYGTPSPSALARLKEAGRLRGFDWDCLWRKDFSRLCVVERPWRKDALRRAIIRLEKGIQFVPGRGMVKTSNGIGAQKARDLFTALWLFGIVKFPLVDEGSGLGDPLTGMPRGLYDRDIYRMLSLTGDSKDSKDPVAEKDEHNARLDASIERNALAREGDIGKFFDKGYRYSRPSEMPEYICSHRKRSRECPVCNPKVGYVGGGRKQHLTDGELVSIGEAH